MGRLHLLLVEDDNDSREVLARLLRLSGYEVHPAANAEDAIAVAAQRRCDVIVSDLGLPDRSGIELMREIRAMHGSEGIALTGRAQADGGNWRAAGFSNYLEKPVDLQLLRATIERVASRARRSGNRKSLAC